MSSPKKHALVSSLAEMIRHYDITTCTHEETKQGGLIWTICCQCDRHWSSDRNPFTPYKEPKFVSDARDLVRQYKEAE